MGERFSFWKYPRLGTDICVCISTPMIAFFCKSSLLSKERQNSYINVAMMGRHFFFCCQNFCMKSSTPCHIKDLRLVIGISLLKSLTFWLQDLYIKRYINCGKIHNWGQTRWGPESFYIWTVSTEEMTGQRASYIWPPTFVIQRK